MRVNVVGQMRSTLPTADDHPYRTGPWRPNHAEYDADDLDVIGTIPADLDGAYLRNTENPVHDSIGNYHPFDGDGMVHMIRFHDGRATYRNRFVRTLGLAAEQTAGGPLWAGLAEPPARSRREDGWGARTRMKDASSTDVVVHAGLRQDELLSMRRPLPPRSADAREPRARNVGRPLPGRGRVGAHQGRRAHRRVAVLQLLDAGAVHALRRGRRRRHARPLRRRPPARSAPAARHGVHRALRHPQRVPAVLGRGAHGQGDLRGALPPRAADALRRHSASR